MIDQLKAAVQQLSACKQSDWLQTWGIDDLVSEGTQYWDKHKSSPDVSAMKMRSREIEAKVLTESNELGSFSVIEVSNNQKRQ
jgi:SAM-dependent MidA family methyltransferase